MEIYEKQGISRKDAMKQVAKDRGVSKREIYQYLLKCGLAKFVSAKRNRRNQKAGCETSEKTREEKFDSPDKIVYKIQ